MIIIFSILAAVIPMLAYLFIIWKFDRYDREPVGLILLNYFWGAFAAIILTLIFSGLINLLLSSLIIDGDIVDYLGSILTAPFTEEITKGLFLLIMIQNKKFDNITDGIVYGGAIGLGFGMTENFFYFVANSGSLNTWIFIVVIRTLFSAVMHCVATGILGAFLGYAKFKNMSRKILLGVTGLIIAMIIHSTWNSFVSVESTAWVGLVFMLVTIIIYILVFSFSVNNEKKIIFSELYEESQSGLIPSEHLHILNSSSRNKFGWVDEGIRKLYISSAIGLAFRKMQHKNSVGLNKNYYEAEVDKLRKTIAILFSKT